jgi:3',5'-cyclic AMP phosphodiesterase CpdA
MLDPEHRRSGARYRLATRCVSMGRPVDPHSRARKLARGLLAAKASGAEHVVISGDLTEMGDPTEFEHFARVLEDAGMREGAVTLVPGNHDAYTSEGSWRRALEGPLRRYASASAGAGAEGTIVDLGAIALLPIDTSFFQSIARSGGAFTRDAARAVEARLADPGLRQKAIVLVMHHPPFERHKTPVARWIDGLRGLTRAVDLLVKHPRLQILHGHLHYVVDRIVDASVGFVGAARRARIFGAPATVDDADETPRVRLYDLRDGALESVGLYAM